MVSKTDFSINTIELQPIDTPGNIDFHTGTKRANHQGGSEGIPRESTPSITNCVLKMLQLQLNFVISLPPFPVLSS
jgi:hypothetical protein